MYRRPTLTDDDVLERIQNSISYRNWLWNKWITSLSHHPENRKHFKHMQKIWVASKKKNLARKYVFWSSLDRCDRDAHRTSEKKQQEYYSGKKKRHTLKTQLLVNKKNKKIIATHFCNGKTHDFELYKRSKLKFTRTTQIDLDLGYKGIEKLHSQVRIPKKKSKYHPLTKKELASNKRIARSRILVEHVIRRLKIFRIVAERYRNRRKRFTLRMNLIAGLYNFELC